MSDAVPLEVAAQRSFAPVLGVKPLVGLFLLFLGVTSNFFVENVVAKVDGATLGRDPTFTGALIQGTCLILGYVALLQLIDGGVV